MVEPVTADVFASPALPLLLRLEDEGIEIAVEGDRLRVRQTARLTPELLAEMRQHKPALLLLIRCCDDSMQARREMFARQLAALPPPRCPAFLFVSDLPYVAGRCFSCGDGLERPRFGRCWRCALAWRLAARVPISTELADVLDAAKVCS